jgi:hypothetical protein
MLPLNRTRVFAVFVLAALTAVHAAERKKKPKPGPEVLVVADASREEAESLRPAPGRPIYYIILGKQERHLGQATAGERMPSPAEIEGQVVGALASQGFLHTKLGGPMPSIAIVISWGEANLMLDEYEYQNPDAGEDEEQMVTETVVWNRREIRQLVGANKPAMLNFQEADMVNEAAREDRLHVTIAALDVKLLAQKKKKLLWRTRISVYALRHTLSEVLPVMLASAAPLFGADSAKPIFVDDATRRKAEVHIGDLQVVEDNAPPPQSPPEDQQKRK